MTTVSNTNATSDLVVNKQQLATKRHLQQAIKTGDLPLLKKLRQLFKVVPNEELGTNNNAWTCLHLACSLDSVISLDFFLKLTYELYKEDYSKIINSKTTEGWNLCMITAMYGASNSLNLLLKYGGVKLYDKDNTGLKAIDLAKKYKKEAVFKMLAKQADSYPQKVITEPADFETPVNVEDLTKIVHPPAAPCAGNVEDQEEHQHLLKCGKRMPCVVCSGENGWLRYSECCGHPMHPLCVKSLKGCPYCNCSKLILTSNVKHPEKAFQLVKTEENK